MPVADKYPELGVHDVQRDEGAVQQHHRPPGVRVRRRPRRCTTSCATTASTTQAQRSVRSRRASATSPTPVCPNVQPDEGEGRRPRRTSSRPARTSPSRSPSPTDPPRRRPAPRRAADAGRRRASRCRSSRCRPAQLINIAIGRQYQAAVWRNHPGADPDTQYVWWHCTAPPGRPRRHPRRPTSASRRPRQGRQQLRQPGQLRRLQRPGHQQGPRTRVASSTDPTARKQAYEDAQPGVRQAALERLWAYWSLWTVPYQPNVHGILGPNLPTATDAASTGCRPVTRSVELVPTCRRSG